MFSVEQAEGVSYIQGLGTYFDKTEIKEIESAMATAQIFFDDLVSRYQFDTDGPSRFFLRIYTTLSTSAITWPLKSVI